MKAVVLTFPGHFFQTVLCLQSLHRWYGPDIDLTLILDDISQGPWLDYEYQFVEYVAKSCHLLPNRVCRTSDIRPLKKCVSGWWRQQLVKITLDQILPGDEWFVIDGDVIFDSHCDVKNIIPISVKPNLWRTPTSILSINYVERLLGINHGYFEKDGQYALTNPIPFRWLQRDLLEKLRSHVEYQIGGDFVDSHLKWFEDQTIIAWEEPALRMLMTEWELIESFRYRILGQQWPLENIGSGYPIMKHTSGIDNHVGVYRHGYTRDTKMPKRWFDDQGLDIPDILWSLADNWRSIQEPNR